MENIKSITIFSILFSVVLAHIESGYVDLNRELNNFEAINTFDNSLCFVQIYNQQFKSVPQITTCLAEFDTNSQRNFQIQIRIRQHQLSSTSAKFLLYARKQISIWNRIVFNYFATDRENIAASNIFLQTQDLSGCGNLQQQKFSIPLKRQIDYAHIVTFLNGMDLTLVENEGIFSDFQVSIDVLSMEKNSFEISISRFSLTQIYSVSIGYLIVAESDSNDFDIIQKTSVYDSIEKSQPYIYEEYHQLDMKNALFFVGIEKFLFQKNENTIIYSLALSLQDQSIILGSLDSSNLQYVQMSYIVVKQTIKCQAHQIQVHENEKLKCQDCPSEQHRIPNQQRDKCVCTDNYYQIKSKCYKLPIGGKWIQSEKSFRCDEELVMIYHKNNDQYLCKRSPKHRMWDPSSQKWVCIDNHYEIDGECLVLPAHAYFDELENKFVCIRGYFFVAGVCAKSYEHQQWSPSLKQFICKEGYYRIGQVCLKPYPYSIYDEKNSRFICIEGYYQVKEGACSQLPQYMTYNEIAKILECMEGYYYILETENCQEKPQNMLYNEKQQKFVCYDGYYPEKGYCRSLRDNEQYSTQILAFVCKKGTYRVKKQCLYPKPNSHYSQLSLNFECNEGYYNVDGECRNPPTNMKYSPSLRLFVCLNGYQYVHGECIKIPKNMIWLESFNQFVCIANYYELEDGSCTRLNENEQYITQTKQIVCKDKYYRIQGICEKLPLNAVYNQQKGDFECQGRYYRKEDSCQSCSNNCLICQNEYQCKKCIQGFQEVLAKCIEVCGDGIKYEDECDDGNTDNQDGCSSKCGIQDGWKCEGGSTTTPDKCTKIEEILQQKAVEAINIRTVGMSHLFGKIILNVKIDYLPKALKQNKKDLKKIFRVLTNSQIPLQLSTAYIQKSKYTFVILYDFNHYEPIPQYLTRIEINPLMKNRYFKGIETKPIYIRINPALMARKDQQKHVDQLL